MRFQVPGMGEKSDEYCNTIVSALFCVCGHLQAVFHHCNKWECPEDYFYTAERAAGRIEERLLGCINAYKTVSITLGRINHVTFSLPPGLDQESFDTKKAWSDARKYAKEVGILGGCMTFHPYRIHKGMHWKIMKALRLRPDLKGGLWTGAHKDILELGSIDKYLYWSPHFHMLAFFPKTLEKSNDFYQRTGWAYKNIDPGKNRNVFTTARYILTHQAIIPGKQSYTYFGICSPNKLGKKESAKTLEHLYCECGSQLQKTPCFEFQYEKYITGELKPESDRTASFFRKIRTYFVRKARQTKLCDSPPFAAAT